VTAFAQAAQERLDQSAITEEALPFRVRQICSYDRRMAVMPFFHELEEDVGLLGF
jgi:hypothetical protein